MVPAAQLDTAADELARTLAAGPTLAYAAIKHAVAYAAASDLPAALELEAQLMASTGATQDHRDAVAAFVAKEKPRFSGR